MKASNFNELDGIGVWKNHTATIDWCEANYEVTVYIAEFWNTLSNLPMILLPLNAIFWCFSLLNKYNKYNNSIIQRVKSKQKTTSNRLFKIPHSIILCNASLLFVGVGSWLFHMTLKYRMQLLDELPMVYCGAMLIYTNYDLITRLKEQRNAETGSTKHVATLKNLKPYVSLAVVVYSLGFSYLYVYVWPSPVFHETAYAFMVAVILVESWLLIGSFKLSYRMTFMTVASYGFGFLLWNIDNNFCQYLKAHRQSVQSIFLDGDGESMTGLLLNILTVSLKALSELHAWWHLFSGYGSFLSILSLTECYFQIHLRNKFSKNNSEELPLHFSSSAVKFKHCGGLYGQVNRDLDRMVGSNEKKND